MRNCCTVSVFNKQTAPKQEYFIIFRGSMALNVENAKLRKIDAPLIWSAEVPSQMSQALGEQGSQQDHVQIMYCKDQVYQGDAEFSLEELRAQRYYRSLSEKASHLQKIKQDLKLQIEQKQRLIQQRISTEAAHKMVHEEAESFSRTSTGSCESAGAAVKAAPFVIYSDQDSCVGQRKSGVSQEDTNQSGSDFQQQKITTINPFSASDENRHTNKPSSSANRVSLKFPSLSLKPPKPKSVLSADKNASVSRSEEAVIIHGSWSKTLCRSPDDTSEFAGAAPFASTPFGGVERQKPSAAGPTVDPGRTAPEPTDAPSSDSSCEEKKLSPILEISQEWGGTSLANLSQDPVRRCNDAGISRAVERPETERHNVSEDVCSPSVRSRLFQQADETTFSNFHRKTGLLPDAIGDDDLNLDGERLFYQSKLGTLKDFTVFSSSTGTVLLKLDSSSVPWDFFISSQLRARLSHDQQDGLVQISCYVYENGCITLWRIPHGETLEDLLDEPIPTQDVLRLVLLLLELVKRFHSCQLVHGGLRPESLYFFHSGVTALDFSNAVDLQLQSDVKTAQDLPSAQKYIQQGLLSPSASPYQVDLISIAEIVHVLLFNRPMKVTQENSAWSLDECSGSQQSAPVNSLWKNFSHMVLGPEGSCSEQVLSELIRIVSDSL